MDRKKRTAKGVRKSEDTDTDGGESTTGRPLMSSRR